MKKILLCLCLLFLYGCSDEKEVEISKEEKYYNEVLKIEDNMKAQAYFKMNKSEDREFIYCDPMNSAQLTNTDTAVENFRFHNTENGIEYISTTKVSDEIQYVTKYYRNGKQYISYSQLPYDISEKDENATYVYFDMAIKAVDLKYYDISKKKEGTDIIYTMTLKKADEYNAKYPEDYNDDACGLKADYKAVKIELKVNDAGLLLEEKITQTIHYQSGELNSEKEGTVFYQFYDYGVEDHLDFSIIE